MVRAAHVVLNGSFLFTELLSFLLRPTKIPPRTGGREGILYPEDVLPKKLSRPKPSCSLAIRVKGLGFVFVFFAFLFARFLKIKSGVFPICQKILTSVVHLHAFLNVTLTQFEETAS